MHRRIWLHWQLVFFLLCIPIVWLHGVLFLLCFVFFYLNYLPFCGCPHQIIGNHPLELPFALVFHGAVCLCGLLFRSVVCPCELQTHVCVHPLLLHPCG